jgi:hypothetical protein
MACNGKVSQTDIDCSFTILAKKAGKLDRF